MTYPFAPAWYDYGSREGPTAGFVVHMAEGGGTVLYLADSNYQRAHGKRTPVAPPRGVSVHYVIEYDGRIVQMLVEAHVSGSINPTTLRTTDDDPFGDPAVTYGVSAARDVLGSWWSNPNHAVITVEVEGFAAVGPNDAQVIALQALIADVRSRHAGIRLLGHRDFTISKACPGKRVPWAFLGGHASQKVGEQVFDIDIPGGARAGKLSAPAGTDAFRVGGSGVAIESPALVAATATSAQHVPGGSYGFTVSIGGVAHFMRKDDVTFEPSDDAQQAHDDTKAAAIAAVEAIP